jgi:hypothetical protein
MAYDRKKIFKQAQDVIREHNLFFIEDIVAWLPCDKTTFYRFFPTECNEYNTLKKLLEDNKVRMKTSIRAKLYKGKGADLIALYKMICSDEERKAIAMVNKTDLTSGDEPLSVKFEIVDGKGE